MQTFRKGSKKHGTHKHDQPAARRANRANLRRILTTALLATLVISLMWPVGCAPTPAGSSAINAGSNTGSSTNAADKDKTSALDDAPYGPYTAKDGTWAIYWYICGSDIELRQDVRFAATGQILEMMKVTLPDNVTVVIEAAGAEAWHLEGIDAAANTRLVYRGNTLTIVDKQPLSNMGDPQTLADFLAFCNLNYPAENQVVIIYNHGGGSVIGIANDALFNMDCLTLPELGQAIQSRPAASGGYELIGLCACLMSTIDCVAILNGYTRYMHASEEVELGCTWDHTKIFTAIAENPKINGAQLGKVIADGYYQECYDVGYIGYTTATTIDMAYADELLAAYNAMGDELLLGATANGSEFLAEYGRAAYSSENYARIESPTSLVDMVDIGDMVINARELCPKSADAMLKAIDKAVVYHITNPLLPNGKGISFYFPYTKDQRKFDAFMMLDTSPGFKYFYEYAIKGELSFEGQEYLASLKKDPTIEPLPDPSELGLDNRVLIYGNNNYYPGSDGHYLLDLGSDANNVAAVFLEVGVYDRDDQDYWLVGTSHELYGDWESGIFYDKFSGTWGCIDGAYCYVEAVANGEDFTLYRVPVLHNGVQKNLMVIYQWTPPHIDNGTYEILGLITTSSAKSNAIEALYEELKAGDVIEPVFLFNSRYNYKEGVGFVLDDSEVKWNPRASITVTESTRFYRQSMGPGDYMIRFLMIDYSGAVHLSEPGYYHIYPEGVNEDGDIVFSEFQ